MAQAKTGSRTCDIDHIRYSVLLHAKSGATLYGMNIERGEQAWIIRDELLADAPGGATYTQALAAELRAQRAGLDLTRKQLAVMSDVPERSLTRIEAGDVSPKAEQVAALVWTMQLSLGDFYAAVEARAVRMHTRGPLA